MTGDPDDKLHAESEPFLTATRMVGLNSFRAWTITETAAGQFHLDLESSVDGEHWTDSERSGPFDSWQNAVRCDPTLTFLRSGQFTEFDIDDGEVQLVEMLTCDPGDEFVSWPSNSVARIGEYEVFFFQRGSGGAPVPLLTGAGGDIIGEEIADYFSDSYHPGDFTETSSLMEYAPGLAVYLSDGDEDNEFTQTAELVFLSGSPSSRASGIAAWIGSLRAIAQYAAMLELAVLDPHDHLNDEQRSEWEVALAHPYCQVKFRIDDATRAGLSSIIVPSDIAEVLEDPLGETGRALYDRLMEDDSLAEMFL